MNVRKVFGAVAIVACVLLALAWLAHAFVFPHISRKAGEAVLGLSSGP